MDVAKRVGSDILDGKPVGALDKLKYRLGDFMIYGPLRNAMGLSRIRVAYTAGAAIGPELFQFFRSIGINLKQLYGQTETCAYVCLQRDGQVDINSVGQAAPGIELKIAENGEVLLKGVSVLKEYYKRPDATAEVLDENGYFKTGDAGVIGANGQLRIIDRAKDVGKMASGAMFAPNYIENKLKFFSHIKEAVCFGNGKDKVCAFVNIDYEAVGNWAERQGIPYGGYVDLASKNVFTISSWVYGRGFGRSASLQILAIAKLLLWFAPCSPSRSASRTPSRADREHVLTRSCVLSLKTRRWQCAAATGPGR